MKLAAILSAIRHSKTREHLRQIMNAAEARDSKLAHIEGERERARLWAKFDALGIQKGDMVFVHAEPKKKKRYMTDGSGNAAKDRFGKRRYTEVDEFVSGQHGKLWAKPLTVQEVKPRSKEIVVRAPFSTVDHRLSPFTCEKLKLSKEPSAAALAAGLKKEEQEIPFRLHATVHGGGVSKHFVREGRTILGAK